MKITRIMTKLGELQKPVSVELEEVVERMRSGRNKEAAQRIASTTLTSRLMMAQGSARYLVRDCDLLPYLMFSATFSQGDLERPNGWTHLVLLTISCPDGQQQVIEMLGQVKAVPFTMMAFAGVSGVTVKVVARCAYSDGYQPRTEDEQLSFLKDAQQTAATLFKSFCHCDIILQKPTAWMGCRMSHDPQLFYNPDATVLPVIHNTADVLKKYEGTRVNDDGLTIVYPDENLRERTELEFQTCLLKAIDECGDDAVRCVQLLADYCWKAHLPEEASVTRAIWSSKLRKLDDDLVRKTFRAAYKESPKGQPLSQMNEKERIMRSIEDFLSRRYQLRYNEVKQLTEFRRNDLGFHEWEPLGDRQLKSMVVEEMKEGGESWMSDIRTYVESAHIRSYNPIHEFLSGVGEWDGKADYIEDYARRLDTGFELWPRYFHRWFLAMVAQAMNLNRDYGNSMVPLLIGPQGFKKSNFCKNILPPSMRDYYMDDIKMDNAEQVERVLTRMWLVNIDEYNSKSVREQAKIKRLLTEKDVQTRRMRSAEYTVMPRLCSFIATTNDSTPLPSGDGSRRYLCVEVRRQVDMHGHIPYRQMFAQAVYELRRRDCVYWFTSDDERIIQQHNRRFQAEQPLSQVVREYFAEAPQRSRQYLMQMSDIRRTLEEELGKAAAPNYHQLSAAFKELGWRPGAISGRQGYYLKQIKSSKKQTK